MGIGYVDSVVVYNRYINGLMETETYFGTRFDNVRVELTQGANQKASGMENASVCVVKIPNANLPKPYKAPEVWNDLTTDEMLESFTLDTEGKNFFVIVKKAELGIDIDVPVGLIDQDETKYVTPCAGVWIEIVTGRDIHQKSRSLPARECGLKLG